MAVIRTLAVELKLQAETFNNGLRSAQREAKEFQKVISPTTKLLSDAGQAMTSLGKGMTAAITLPLASLGALSVKAASDFESSFAGVRKTVDATEAEFKQLSDGFRQMSKEIPTSVNELNKIGEAAGQLGIKKDDILAFTRAMADLSVTTNLTSDEAATATAQIQNIFGAAGKDVDRFASTLVALGNAGASTEKDIIEMGLRIAGAGHQIGLTQSQVLALASTLSSVGIKAEEGGSAISRVFLKMNDAIAGGGEKMAAFARVAGMSAAEFKKAFQADAASALTEFISGLGRLKAQGENVNATLEDLFGKNIVIKDTLLRASGAGSLLAEQLAIGNKAWQENTALVKEATQRYGTFESQLKTFWNQINDIAITLGTAVLPVLNNLLTSAKPLIDLAADAARWFGSLSPQVQTVAVALAALAAAAGPVIAGIGLMLSGISGAIPLLTTLSTALPALGLSLGGIATVLTGPVGIVAAITAGGAALLYFVSQNQEGAALLNEVWTGIKQFAGETFTALSDLIRVTADSIMEIWRTYGPSITLAFQQTFATWVPVITETLNLLKTLITSALTILKGAIQTFTGAVTLDWGRFSEGIKNIWKGLWDAIVGIVTAPLKAAKESIQGFTKSVTDYFATMYDKIVGHSFVPELIKAIETEFGKLGKVMKDPARVATTSVTDSFKTMFDTVFNAASTWRDRLKAIFNTVIDIITQLKPQLGSILNSIGGAINGTFGGSGGTGGLPTGVGATPPTFPTQAQGAAIGQAVGGATAAQIGGMVAGPIGLALAPNYGVNKYDFKALAKAWVRDYQNPFDQAVIKLMQSFNAMRTAGTLTTDQAQEYRNSLAQILNEYMAAAGQFSARSWVAKNVVDQAMGTLNTNWGEGLSKLFGVIDQTITQLKQQMDASTKAAATAPTSAPTYNNGTSTTPRRVAGHAEMGDWETLQLGPSEVHFDHIEINITAPVQVAQKIDRRTVRDEIMPEWFSYVEDAAGERLTKIVKNRLRGVVTTA